MSPVWSDELASEIVRGAFSALFGREPDEEAHRFYVDHLLHGRLRVDTFLQQLTDSTEFAEKSVSFGYSADRDPTLGKLLSDPQVQRVSARLASADTLDIARFDALIAEACARTELVAGQQAYVPEHRVRFIELFTAAHVLTFGRDRPRVLEFGASVFSSLYRHLVPNCRLIIADRPLPAGQEGFDANRCRSLTGAEAFLEVDLEGDLHDAHSRFAEIGPVDLVVFTEVLEHLNRHPVEVIEFLLKLLTAEGSLYLTTPNAFSRGKLHMIGRRRNPQQVFPRSGANWDVHHHVREYGMAELVEYVSVAGGVVRGLHFSSCWDPADEEYLTRHPDQRGNLVIVAGRLNR